MKFSALLKDYANNPVNRKMIGEHDHYGPYMHLTIRTSNQPKILKCEIWGTISDIRRLAELVEEHLNESNAGDKFIVGDGYAANNECALEFEVWEEGFDSPGIDPYLVSNELESKQ